MKYHKMYPTSHFPTSRMSVLSNKSQISQTITRSTSLLTTISLAIIIMLISTKTTMSTWFNIPTKTQPKSTCHRFWTNRSRVSHLLTKTNLLIISYKESVLELIHCCSNSHNNNHNNCLSQLSNRFHHHFFFKIRCSNNNNNCLSLPNNSHGHRFSQTCNKYSNQRISNRTWIYNNSRISNSSNSNCLKESTNSSIRISICHNRPNSMSRTKMRWIRIHITKPNNRCNNLYNSLTKTESLMTMTKSRFNNMLNNRIKIRNNMT